MKKIVSLAALAAFLCVGISATFVRAEDAKEVTLKGTALCGKCELHQDPKCNCILKVTEGGKDVLYYLSGKVSHSKDFCKGTKDLSVVGTPGPDMDGHKTFKVTKVIE